MTLARVVLFNRRIGGRTERITIEETTREHTGIMISMCSCAPGYFHVDIFSIFRVIALDLVKIYNI
jgi:hypothetical protein